MGIILQPPVYTCHLIDLMYGTTCLRLVTSQCSLGFVCVATLELVSCCSGNVLGCLYMDQRGLGWLGLTGGRRKSYFRHCFNLLGKSGFELVEKGLRGKIF